MISWIWQLYVFLVLGLMAWQGVKLRENGVKDSHLRRGQVGKLNSIILKWIWHLRNSIIINWNIIIKSVSIISYILVWINQRKSIEQMLKEKQKLTVRQGPMWCMCGCVSGNIDIWNGLISRWGAFDAGFCSTWC